MDAVSYSHADKQKKRIEKIIANPDSTSGIVTVPSTIASGETITIPSGRMAVLPNLTIDGTLVVDGEVFVPSGATFSDLEAQLALKAPLDGAALVNPTINGLAQSGYTGFKNYIINGCMRVNQYPAFTTTEGYKYDRWGISGGTNFGTIFQASLNGEASSNKALAFTKTNSSTSWIWTKIEFPRILAGKTVTLSFRAYSNTGYNMPANVYFDKYNPTDGFSNATTGQNFTWNNSWNKRTMTFTLPTLGTNFNNDNSYFQLNFSMTGTTTGAYLTDVQLEEGSVATPFEQRPYGLELSLCQRYYEVANPVAAYNSSILAQYNASFVQANTINFCVSKRIAPTCIISLTGATGHTGTQGSLYSVGANMNGISPIFNWVTGTAGREFIGTINWTASAEL